MRQPTKVQELLKAILNNEKLHGSRSGADEELCFWDDMLGWLKNTQRTLEDTTIIRRVCEFW